MAQNAATTPYRMFIDVSRCRSRVSDSNVDATRSPEIDADVVAHHLTCGHGCDRTVCTAIRSACTRGRTRGRAFAHYTDAGIGHGI